MGCTQHHHEDAVISEVALLARFAYLHDYIEVNDIKNQRLYYVFYFYNCHAFCGVILSIVHS